MSKKRFWMQGLIITLISVMLRVMNIGYRSYLSQKIGPEGMGLYQLIFSVFMLSVTLSTSGISLAVTRMVTRAMVSGKQDTIRSLLSKCFLFCLLCSLCISLLLFTGSDFAALRFLGNPRAAPCLRILALALPFMSVCTCMKGYFLAVDEAASTSVADLLENLLTIGATVFLFWQLAPKGIEAACFGAMLSSTLGEMVSCGYSFLLYRRSLRRHTPPERNKSNAVLHGLTHIALPCTLSAAARSVLSTVENLLIPRQLQKNGQSYQHAMAQYGMLQGMTMPILYFPSSLLSAFANLLIPRISMERESRHQKSVAYITGKALCAAFTFGILFAAIFFVFGESWGNFFLKSPQAGSFLRVLAPIVPLIYLDVVVDCLLKGMDEQLNSMKFNLADTSLRVLLVLTLMQRLGMKSYLGILFFSTIFNASLSLGRLIRVTKVKLFPVRQLLLPALSALFSVLLTRGILLRLPPTREFLQILLQLLLSGLLFFAFSYLLGRIVPPPGTEKADPSPARKGGAPTKRPQTQGKSSGRVTAASTQSLK